MRIMFQPDALHHQAPSNHTRHHHTLSGPPEKTSGFNIPNAPTASPHAARRTPHAARCTLHAQLTTTRPQLSVKLSLLPSRHDTASPHSQHRPPAHLSSPTAPNAPHLHGPSSPTPHPHQGGSPHTSSCTTPDPETQRIQATSPTPPSPHLPRYISPGRIHPGPPGQNHPRQHPCTATSAPGLLGSSASCTCPLPSPTDANLYSFTRSHHADHRRHPGLARRIHRPATRHPCPSRTGFRRDPHLHPGSQQAARMGL